MYNHLNFYVLCLQKKKSLQNQKWIHAVGFDYGFNYGADAGDITMNKADNSSSKKALQMTEFLEVSKAVWSNVHIVYEFAHSTEEVKR
jgi:hypothetical protein